MTAWLIWLIAATVLLIIELLSGAAAALCLAVGCAPAAFAAALGAPVWVQAVIALVGTVIALVFIGPVVRRIYASRHDRHDGHSNMDAIIGRTGRVTHEITDRQEDRGRVQIDGDSWLAYTTSPHRPIARGEQVIVEAYDSIILRVRPLKNEETKQS